MSPGAVTRMIRKYGIKEEGEFREDLNPWGLIHFGAGMALGMLSLWFCLQFGLFVPFDLEAFKDSLLITGVVLTGLTGYFWVIFQRRVPA